MRKYKNLLLAIVLMIVLFFNTAFAYIVSAEEESQIPDIEEAREALQKIREGHTIMALVYLSAEYPIRKEASYEGEIVITVPSGQQVQIKDVYKNEYDEAWEYVTLYYQDNQYEGYVPRANLACSDELFLAWEEEYNMKPVRRLLKTGVNQTYDEINQFPESYRAALTALKNAHPKWTFVMMNTELDWNTVVKEEMLGGRSLVPTSFEAPMKNGTYGSGWSYASEGALKYYLDPRNGLTENYIFQFEQLTYNETYHTESAVQNFLNGTFMAGIVPDTVLTYAKTFWAIGKELQVSPFHLACRVYQEQGQGNSPLISGTYPGYEGWYNYFNIGASGTTNQEIYESGLAKAKEKNWYNGYYSILGGAKVISENYILKGQDTLYLQKFDVDNSANGMYWHQYMQNICAPTSEGQNIRKLYNNAKSLENTFVFKIPVYNNMPVTACAKPTISYDVSLTPPEGYVDDNIYLDGVAYPVTKQGAQSIVTAENGNAKTAVMYKYNESGVPTGMYVWTLSHNGTQYQATAVSGMEDLLSYHGFSIRITGKSGIRFKTGISSTVKSQLTTTGISGYTLKEYGTLVMNNTNREQYPMIKDGEKVLSGMSYGKNSSGQLENVVYETVSGRQRFTSVLVGLPANQYKTEYAFRGYIVLTKNGTDITLYGPIVSKSIYSLAQQLIVSGQYEEGSSTNIFLQQLIEDADK